jgi:hypothetical protein
MDTRGEKKNRTSVKNVEGVKAAMITRNLEPISGETGRNGVIRNPFVRISTINAAFLCFILLT